MSDPQLPSPHLAQDKSLGSVRVTIGPESRTQVVLAGFDPHVLMEARSLRDSSLELVGPVFFPKNCHLDMTTEQPVSGEMTHFSGTVRSVKMSGPEPSYAVTVHLDQGASAELALGSKSIDGASRPAGLPALAAGTVPGWASLLVSQQKLSEAELHRIASDARARRIDLEDALTREGVVTSETISACMALDLSLVYVEPRAYELCAANKDLVPEQLARRHSIYPLFHTGGVITLGMKDATDLALIDQVRLRTNHQVDPCVCPPGTVESLIDQAYRTRSAEPDAQTAPPVRRSQPAPSEESDSNNAIVRLVHSMVAHSARSGASDIHIEPERDYLRIRIRVDGILHETATHALELHAPIVSRIKVKSKLDIAETRRPQDGHFTMAVEGMTVDARVSTIPTVHGENVVLRLLMSDSETIQLDRLGMPPGVLRRFQHFLDQPNGMVLVTGPTGSGKTSTLYAALERMNTMDRNIVTVEDPVEKRVPLLRQTEVNPKAGVNFASGLRSILRQDPDVIMVGEIRDAETAEIAVQAALTGHLVLSTLHTNTAAGAIVRLNEMGVTPFLLTSSLRAVIGQRLARRVCKACAHETAPDPKLVAGLRMEDAQGVKFMAGRGCAHCLQTGYKGRVGIYEILEITESLGQALLGGASREQIEREAEDALSGSLRIDGLRKVRDGATTLEEVARIVGWSEPEVSEEL